MSRVVMCYVFATDLDAVGVPLIDRTAGKENQNIRHRSDINKKAQSWVITLVNAVLW